MCVREVLHDVCEVEGRFRFLWENWMAGLSGRHAAQSPAQGSAKLRSRWLLRAYRDGEVAGQRLGHEQLPLQLAASPQHAEGIQTYGFYVNYSEYYKQFTVMRRVYWGGRSSTWEETYPWNINKTNYAKPLRWIIQLCFQPLINHFLTKNWGCNGSETHFGSWYCFGVTEFNSFH